MERIDLSVCESAAFTKAHFGESFRVIAGSFALEEAGQHLLPATKPSRSSSHGLSSSAGRQHYLRAEGRCEGGVSQMVNPVLANKLIFVQSGARKVQTKSSKRT